MEKKWNAVQTNKLSEKKRIIRTYYLAPFARYDIGKDA